MKVIKINQQVLPSHCILSNWLVAKKDYKDLKNRVQQSDKKIDVTYLQMHEKETKRHKATHEVQNVYKEKTKHSKKISMTHKTASKQYKMKMDTKKDYKGMQND